MINPISSRFKLIMGFKMQKAIKILLHPLAIALFCGCVSSDKITLNDLNTLKTDSKIIRLRDRAPLQFNEFINELSNVDVLVIGELHENKNHKAAEILLIETLATIKNLDVAFEMISSEKQPLIDKAYADTIPPENLLSAINWDKSWSVSHYGDIVKSAYKSANLKAANLSKNEINTIFAGAEPIKGDVSTTKGVKDKIKEGIELSHGKMDDKTLAAFIQIQQYKDRRMADVLNRANNSALLIAGSLHTFKDVGVPLHLIDFKTKKRVKVLILGSDDYEQGAIDSTKADYIWNFK